MRNYCINPAMTETSFLKLHFLLSLLFHCFNFQNGFLEVVAGVEEIVLWTTGCWTIHYWDLLPSLPITFSGNLLVRNGKCLLSPASLLFVAFWLLLLFYVSIKQRPVAMFYHLYSNNCPSSIDVHSEIRMSNRGHIRYDALSQLVKPQEHFHT